MSFQFEHISIPSFATRCFPLRFRLARRSLRARTQCAPIPVANIAPRRTPTRRSLSPSANTRAHAGRLSGVRWEPHRRARVCVHGNRFPAFGRTAHSLATEPRDERRTLESSTHGERATARLRLSEMASGMARKAAFSFDFYYIRFLCSSRRPISAFVHQSALSARLQAIRFSFFASRSQPNGPSVQ